MFKSAICFIRTTAYLFHLVFQVTGYKPAESLHSLASMRYSESVIFWYCSWPATYWIGNVFLTLCWTVRFPCSSTRGGSVQPLWLQTPFPQDEYPLLMDADPPDNATYGACRGANPTRCWTYHLWWLLGSQVPAWTDKLLWKHHLAQTSFTRGKNERRKCAKYPDIDPVSYVLASGNRISE